MNTIAFIVRLRVPDHISQDHAQRELKTCISFGQPEVQALYLTPDD